MSFKTTFTLSEVYNKQLSGIWPTAFYDYFEKTSLLIGTNETTFITDASTNNWTLTPLASVNLLKAKNDHPYQPGYYSTNFNGSSYLTVPTTTGFTLSGDFTIECWAYMNSYASSGGGGPTFLSGTNVANNWLFAIDATAIYWYWNQAGVLTATVANTTGEWVHLAVSRSGSTLRIFKNGTIVGTATNSSSYTLNNSVLYIGSQNTTAGLINGYISNLRVVKGTAVYTTAFVPPTTPLTAIQGTVLLTCMDSYHAERITPNSITAVGVPSTRSFTPFSSSIPSIYSSYGSANINNASLNNTAFTGANFGTSADFTIESWMKWDATTASNYTSYEFNGTTRTIIGRSSTGLRLYLTGTEKGFAYTFISNVWYHIAIVRSLLTYYVYINGVLATTAFTLAGNHSYTTLTIGRNYDTAEIAVGLSLSDFRVVNGTAVYGGNFIPPTAPLTAITNTTLLTFQNDKEIANSTFYDDSSMKNLLTTSGTPTQGTFSPISANGWSTYFNGSTDHLTVANTESLNLTDGSPDWTIEARVYCTALTAADQNILNKDGVVNTSYSQYGLSITSTGVIKGSLGTGGGASGGDSETAYGTAVISLNTWTHIAFVNKAGTISLYVNGVLNFSGAIRGMRASTSLLYIGYQNGQPTANRFNGFITDARIMRGIAAYTSNFTPSTIPLTAVLGTSMLACQDNRFKDNSVNNSVITAVGTPSIQPFSPYYPSQKTIGTTVDYVGNSNFFTSASSSYLSIASTASLVIGASDFTVECWIYLNTIPSASPEIIRTGNFHLNFRSSGTFAVTTDASVLVSSASALATGLWYHIAAVRTAGFITIYINGIGGTPVADTTTFTQGTTGISETPFLNGYISNLRVVNGTAVYTTSFTPPTAPLTAIPGTALLTCQDSLFRDNSVNALTIVRNGSPQISTVTPFTATTSTSYDVIDGGSMYLSKTTNDYMSLPSSSTAYNFAANVDFTFEAWVYPTEYLAGTWGIFDARAAAQTAAAYLLGLLVVSGTYRLNFYNAGNNTGSTIINLNTWTHVAVVRSGTFLRLYVNGVLDTSFSAYGASISPGTTAPYIGTKDVTLTGHGTSGYISNFRLVNGTALYIANFNPSTVLRDIPGTVLLVKGNNAGIYDATGRNNLVTLGDAKPSKVIKKYGNNSLYFDGTGDYLTIPSSPNYAIGTGNYTFEAWIYPISSSGSILETSGGIQIGYQSTTQFGIAQRGVAWKVFTSAAPTLNAWSHIAIVRFGTGTNQTVVFVNGVATVGTDAVNYGTADGTATVGSTSGGGSNYFNGYIDDLRFTRGLARYTTTFTPPPRLGLVP